MLRPAASRLRALKGNANASGFASASAAAMSWPPSCGVNYTCFREENSNTIPSLQFPLPGVTVAPPLPDSVEPSKTQITILPNGVKIASETSPSPVASIGLYVDCGSVYENSDVLGLTYLLRKMAFKGTTNRSYLQLLREVEAIGGNVAVSATREQMGYTYDALKTYVPQMVELLVDSVRNPVFLDSELDEQVEKGKEETAEAINNTQGYLLEHLHCVAYCGGLRNSPLPSEFMLDGFFGTDLQEFVAENYTAPRMVLAASGVDHEEIVSIAEPLLSDLPAVSRPVEPLSFYVGGKCGRPAISPTTHIALAFEVPGGWKTEKDAITSAVLQILMGGGGFSTAGGPGKGMFSRLYLHVINEYQEIKSCSAFNSIYNSSGLFGIHVATEPKFAHRAAELVARELLEVATPGKVKQVELDRVKAAAKSAQLMNLESRMTASEDIGRQILTYGERKPVDYFLKAIDAVTLEDIASTAQKLFSSRLTMGAIGDVGKVQSYDSVSSMFL